MRIKQLSQGGAGGSNKVNVLTPLTKTIRALFSTAAEKFVPGWGNGKMEGFGPQSVLSKERRELAPRKVPPGRGVAGSK